MTFPQKASLLSLALVLILQSGTDAAQQLPLRVFSQDVQPRTETATLNNPGGTTNLTSLTVWWERNNGTNINTAVKLNTGYIDNIHVLPVDESIDTTAATLTNDTPLIPSTIWAFQTPGSLDFSWFGVRTWDIGDFDV